MNDDGPNLTAELEDAEQIVRCTFEEPCHLSYCGACYPDRTMTTVRLFWTASRDWTDPLRMWEVLAECRDWAGEQGKTLVIVHGDAPGGDQIGKLYGLVREGCEEESHPADWEGPCRDRCKPGHRRRDRQGRDYCPAAGNYRNEYMAALGADRGAAFIKNSSSGATHGARVAEAAGIPVRRYTA